MVEDVPTISEAANCILRRKISALELTTLMLERIEITQPYLNAFITLTAEKAVNQAKMADIELARGYYKGPMHGIPIGVKDIYASADILTTGNSKLLQTNVPMENCAVIEKLYSSGAILLGKLAGHEFSHGGPSFDLPWPPARNPWNIAHFTGGSSSGSGAAVAAGLVLGAMGSDTGGSIRNPASLCGTVGMKPTSGLISRYGVIPNSYTFDTCGPLTWTVEDCAIMLESLVGYDSRDGNSLTYNAPRYKKYLNVNLHGLRVGVIRHFWEEDLPANNEVKEAINKALLVLVELGAEYKDVRLHPLQHYSDIKLIIAESELFALHHRDLILRPNDFGQDFLARSLPAVLFSGSDYVNAQRERRRILAEMEVVYQNFDVLITPSLYGPAPVLSEPNTVNSFWREPSIAVPFNVTGGPAISICMGFSRSGLPIGLQIAAKQFDDLRVLQVAHAYEQATPWRTHRPSITAYQGHFTNSMPGQAVENLESCPPQLRDEVRKAAKRHGLSLNDEHLAYIERAAPYAKACASRLDIARPYRLELANSFRF